MDWFSLAGDPSGTEAPMVNPVTCCGTAEPAAEEAGGRYRLWELDPGLHCSIIGTCLDLDELRRIAQKASVTIATDAEDYDFHGYFVTRSASRSPVSKLVHKALDRKYAGQVARFRRSAAPDELRQLWRAALASGDIAGAYWALMTHRGVPPAQRIRAHNEVHMLSHLMGRSARADIKRLRALEASCAELTERLDKARSRSEAALQERDARIRALEAQLAAAANSQAVPLAEERRAPAMRLDRLQARLVTLERRIKVERARARAAEARVDQREAGPESPPAAAPPALPESAASNLHGQALLYVGGHPNVAPHLRDHVERMCGRFLYHDGGIEAQVAALPGLVSQADAVFCPVACVSHDACLRLKHLCRRYGKRFILLRSAGLSSFVTALDRVSKDGAAA